jgi:adenylate cyclase, class 1
MARAVNFSDGIGRKELQLVRRRFRGLQRERLRRIEADLNPNQRDFVNLLPLLFHLNHPVLPGFIGSDTPAGIPDYSPPQTLLRTARKLGRSFSYKKRVRRSYNIHGLYLMGSIGSIAHTSGSDFDVWLCHDQQLDPQQLQALHEKASKLEQSAAEINLEVHIFLMDVEAFRRGDREAISRESSGSTQKQLLLEEFYRTGILLAGRHPLWWLVPPDQEENYTEYTSMLLHKRFVDPLDCLNFGSLEHTPADEFFGAARWQLYKGIESPYKSVLKLLLVEAYSRDYPNIRWLCQEAKAEIYNGVLDLDTLDPYILMYQRVEQYLTARKEPERLELARRCFYFKAERPLSIQSRGKHRVWQIDLLKSVVDSWGWNSAKLTSLDSRHNWKIDQVLNERNILVRELTNSYHMLTEFSRTYAASGQIDPDEISLLGRKLYTALERQPGKVDSINPGISHNLVEQQLSLHYIEMTEGSNGWLLYCGEVDEQAIDTAIPIKKTAGLIEMLSWIQVNGLADPSTTMTLFPEACPVEQKELRSLLNSLYKRRHALHTGSVPLSELTRAAYAKSATLFVNTGIDPLERLSREGKQLTSDRSDALSFGSSHTCLVNRLEQLIVTSWGETLITHHNSTTGLADSICRYLSLTLHHNPERDAPKVVALGHSSIRAAAIAKRVEMLFNNVCANFGPEGHGLDSRYLFQADDDYYLIQKDRDGFSYFSVGSGEELFAIMGQPQSRFRPLVIDNLALQDTPLPIIMQQNLEGLIQIYYHNKDHATSLYIVDEQGALFQQEIPGNDEKHLLVQQKRFFSDLLITRSLQTDDDALSGVLDAPIFFSLSKDQSGNWITEARTPPRDQFHGEYTELRMITEGINLNQSPHLLLCDNHEFSSLEYGDGLFHAVAKFIMAQRHGNRDYPIYITGIEFTRSALEQRWSTVELLQFKKRLESRLNVELKKH